MLRRRPSCGIGEPDKEGGGYVTQSTDWSLVLGVFHDELAADTASRAVRRGLPLAPPGNVSVGVLAKRSDGGVPAVKLGPRKTGAGPGVGALLGIVASAVQDAHPTDVVTPTGGFFHEGFGLTRDDVSRIGAELDSERAIVAALADSAACAAWVIVELAELGGKTESHEVTSEALQAAAG